MVALVGVRQRAVRQVVVDVELGRQEALDARGCVRGPDQSNLRIAGALVVQAEGADDGVDVVRCERRCEGGFRGVVARDCCGGGIACRF